MPDEQKDELSPKLEHAVNIIGDLLKVSRAYGENGPKAVYVHTSQLSEDEMRTVITAFVTYASAHNVALGELLKEAAAAQKTGKTADGKKLL